jgi:beta-1,4-mannosyltransferase
MKYRVVSLPGRGDPSHYVDLFYNSIKPYGIELIGKLTFDTEWLISNIDTFDAIHLHWPENVWRNYTNPHLKKLRYSFVKGGWRVSFLIEQFFRDYFNRDKLKWFEKNITYLKNQGKHILWTWHNVEPHENVSELDFYGFQILANNSDLIIFHSDWAEAQSRKNHQIRSKTIIMSLGNYNGVYPEPRERSVVASELGFDLAKPIVGCLGSIRGYKGLDIACEAIDRIGDSVQFLCAGSPHPAFDLNSLEHKISKINHAVLIPRMITDQEFSDYANLCEFLLLPYKKITGSAALLASLTLKRGVIASDLPFFREVLSKEPNAGLLVEPNDPDALASAITSYLNVPANIRSTAAYNLSDQFKWSKVVMPVVKSLQDIIGCKN